MINTRRVAMLKRKFQTFVDRAPMTVTILRPNMIPDGQGGERLDPLEPNKVVATVTGTIDDTNMRAINNRTTDMGKFDIAHVIRFNFPYDPNIRAMRDDYFFYEGERYYVETVNNGLGLSVWWELEVNKDTMSSRGGTGKDGEKGNGSLSRGTIY